MICLMFPNIDVTGCPLMTMLFYDTIHVRSKQLGCRMQSTSFQNVWIFMHHEDLEAVFQITFKDRVFVFWEVPSVKVRNSALQYFSFIWGGRHCGPQCYKKNCRRSLFFFLSLSELFCVLLPLWHPSVTIYHWDIFSSVDKRYIPYLICRASAAQPSWMLMWIQPSFCV